MHSVLRALHVCCLLAWACATSNESFRPELASMGLDLSNAAYCEKADITEWGCLPCQRLEKAGAVPVEPPIVVDGVVGGYGKAKRWGTRAVITALSGDRIAVSFRGSDNLTNWLEDFDFLALVPYEQCPECKVHVGFYKSWLSLAREVFDSLLGLVQKYPKADVLVTGHSLGAAQAVLAATDLYYLHGLPVTQVYTFGQPRVGNAAFHHFYNNGTSQRQYHANASSFRVVHYRDPVPLAPFRFMGFEHTSTEVWYNENSSSYKVCDSSGEDPSCSRSLGFNLLHGMDHTSYLARPTGGAACIVETL